jgi:hypothetical protein
MKFRIFPAYGAAVAILATIFSVNLHFVEAAPITTPISTAIAPRPILMASSVELPLKVSRYYAPLFMSNFVLTENIFLLFP